MTSGGGEMDGGRATIASDFHERRVGGQVFVLRADSSMHILDNAAAITLWDALREAGDEGIGVPQLTGALTLRYEVDEVTARNDVVSFLTYLADAGLVRLTAGAGD